MLENTEIQPSLPDVHHSITTPGALVQVKAVTPMADGVYTVLISDTMRLAAFVCPVVGTFPQDAVPRKEQA